ncbi:MAG: MFS transporter [Bacteroidota bacterium]
MEMKVNRSRLFLGSCMALVVTSMTFAIRARLELVFREDFSLTAEQLGFAFGPAFYGFTIAMIIGGPLVDVFGMKRIVWLAFFSHLIGIVVTLFARDFWTLFAGTLAIGIGNGMVEAACNPLVATMYSDQKTKMLNRFHVWFPGGIVIGSLLAYLLMDMMGLSWQVLVGTLFIPLVVYGFLFLGQSLPQTERVAMGISSKGMWKAVGTPLFLFMAFCMLLTASTELGTNQRIDALLQSTGVSGILVLAFINGIMMFGRAFAGPVVHSLSTTGMLLFSAIFSFLGLLWLSYASGYTIFAAAAIFAIGICYFWPTMLGFVSEKIPASGALGLSIIGGLGMFSVSIVLPIMGNFMDADGGQGTLRYVAILPAILIAVFAGLYFFMKSKKDKEVATTQTA